MIIIVSRVAIADQHVVVVAAAVAVAVSTEILDDQVRILNVCSSHYILSTFFYLVDTCFKCKYF